MGNGFYTLADRYEIRDLIESGRFDIDKTRLHFFPYVSGVEVTQAIQYYKASQHLTDVNDRGPNNSVGLAALKPAWVRVYARSGFHTASQTVTGKIVVERQATAYIVIYSGVGTFLPAAPGTIVAPQSADYATERGTLASSLNFIIPAAEMWGKLRLTITIWSQGGDENSPDDTEQIYIDATKLQTLRVRGILVSYSGPNASGTVANMNLPAPSVADLQTTCGNTFTVYPVESTGVFSSGGTIDWDTPLTGLATAPGGCSQQWLDLNVEIAQARTNDGNRPDVLYVGLIPSTVPIANVGGCNSSGVSAVPNGEQWTMAHELGHACGLAHGPCGTPGDPNYPAYEPYDPANTPTSALGEYGLDINDGTIHVPTQKDFMSYCGPVWISLYHAGRLFDNAALDPRPIGVPTRIRIPDLYDPWLWPWEYIPDPPPWELPSHYSKVTVQPIISLIGIVDLVGELSVSSVMRLEAVGRSREGEATNLVAELVGASGEVVARANVMQTHAHGSGCGCGGGGHDHSGHGSSPTGYAFQAILPDVETGSALRIVRIDPDGHEEQVEVWSRRPEGKAPQVRDVTVRIGRSEGEIRWSVKDAKKDVRYSIQYSKDKGVSWNGMIAGITKNRHTFSLADMPSGSARFRIFAHDGFHTTRAESKLVKLPPRPPAASIMHPYDGRSYPAGAPLRLLAAASTHLGARNPKLTFEWEVDGKRAGEGAECWIVAPKPGKHVCRVRVQDDGGKSEATARFTTFARE